MLLCDSCNGGYHIFCLANQLPEVPIGDWYCDSCIDEQEQSANAKFGFEMGGEYALSTFKAKADDWKALHFKSSTHKSALSIQEIEKEYWRILNLPNHKIEVEYGSDIDTGAMGSGFPVLDKLKKIRNRLLDRWKAVHLFSSTKQDAKDLELKRLLAEGLQMDIEANFDSVNQLEMYASSPWNLTNLPKLNGSLLQYLDEDIKGVMVPWMYVGMCFSTFCWHVEDHNFYSISYLHRGAPKTWYFISIGSSIIFLPHNLKIGSSVYRYGVPGPYASKMESVMRQLTPALFGNQPDLHLQLVYDVTFRRLC
jgi:histone demethylase JARID1